MTEKELKSIKNFIETFEQVFDKDWSCSSAMLSEDLFRNEMGTFLKGEWITNWYNRDDLISTFNILKETVSRNNKNMHRITAHLTDFLHSFEEVFHADWEYTKLYLGIEEDFKEGIIADTGTFLHPKLTEDELKTANWGFRDLLLKYYKEVKEIK